jgi:phage protein D
VDHLAPVFDGEVTRISPEFPESGAPTVRVEGHTRLHWLRGSSKTRTFLDMADSDIARKIASELGLRADTERTRIKHPYIMQLNQTDLAFLVERARRIRYEVLVEDHKLIFRKAKDGEQKRYTLVWGDPQRGWDPDRQILPLQSVSLTMNTLGQANRVVVRGQHPKTREGIVGQAGSGDEDPRGPGRPGPKVASEAFSRTTQTVVVDTPVASRDEAEQLARAIYNERALEFVTGSGSSMGTPELRAGRVVELLGLGPRFSGLYYLTQSIHTIGEDGYVTRFNVRRNAVG